MFRGKKGKKGQRTKEELNKEKIEDNFQDFSIFEYNLFWALHLLIVLFIISYLGGSVRYCLERFFQMINPANWL